MTARYIVGDVRANSGWWVLVFAILALSGFGLMVAGTLTA